METQKLQKYSKLLFTLLFVLSLQINIVSSKTCRALALRGGGTKGSYEVGVLKAF